MEKLYKFNQFLNESSVGDFAQNLSNKLDFLKDFKEKDGEDEYSELKSNPLGKNDGRKDWVGKLQDALVKLKHMADPGKYRGTFGDKTQAAVKSYQKSKGKAESGEVNDELMRSILDDAKK